MNEGYSLIVPMQVQALCVGTADAAQPFALRPMADFSTLPYQSNGQQTNRKPYVSADVIARGGPFAGETALPVGIHLHWSLPAGLMNGQQQENGSLLFPKVPNRWMVTRMVLRNASSVTNAQPPAIDQKSWIVESDRLNTTAVAAAGLHQPTVPTDPDALGQNFRFIGQAFPAGTWAEDPNAERFDNLTAVGYGEASFASYYPNCCTVFGFYDDMVNANYNPNHDQLSYQVTGWYSDSSQDPLAGGITSGDNPYNWVFSDGETVANLICAGLIQSIPWNSVTPYISDPGHTLSAALGASVQETVSALMANKSGFDPDTTETLLNALQFGLLAPGRVLSGSIQQFEEFMHEAGFASFNAGIEWQVRKRVPPGTDTDYEGEVTLPEPVAQDLNQLNEQQQQLDKLKGVLVSKRWQLFSDWYKYLQVEYETKYTPEAVRDRAQQVRGYLLDQAAAINELDAQVNAQSALQQRIDTLSGFIAGLLDAQYELTHDTAAPRYWQALNPCMVLYGDDITPVSRSGGPAPLVCRPDNRIMNEVDVLPGVIEPGGAGVDTQTPALLTFTYPPTIPELARYVLNDAILSAPSLQPAMAVVICNRYNLTTNQYTTAMFQSVLGILQDSLTALYAGQPLTDVRYENVFWDSQPPNPLGMFVWNNTPWLPIMLQYSASFSPVAHLSPGDVYPENFILDNFAWDTDGIELEYNGALPASEEMYEGTVFLSADAQVNLTESIRQFMVQTNSTDPDLQHALDSIAGVKLLAQELSGLTQSMLMRQQVLQMKVADPLANSFDESFVQTVRDAVGSENVYSPEPDRPFNPVRAGSFRLSTLRLIDVFGQYRDRSMDSTVIAKGLMPPPQLHAATGTAFLPPRITQPSRLLFRWLSADYDSLESNSHPASTPVIGWVLPDYPDNSLFIYNADGVPLGELAVSADNSTVLWLPAPGGLFPPGTNLQTVMQDQLAWLRNFMNGIYNNGNPSVLATLLASLTNASGTLPVGGGVSTTGILTGQPLAITRASLTLDIAGEAALSESWESFTQSIAPGGSADDAGFTEIKFPVKLGMPGALNDGLFAFWKEEGGRIDFTQFYDPQSDPNAVTLTAGANAASTRNVLMLVDPKGAVHATTGILPVKFISVPKDQYEAALNAMSVTFLTAPVLSGTNTPSLSIPLPKTTQGSWSWISASTDGWQSQDFDSDVPNADQGTLDYTPQQIREGWLRLRDFENNN